MASIRDGYGLVSPRNAETAKALLDAAGRAGVNPVDIRTSVEGYIVPDAVLEEYIATLPKEEVAVKPQRRGAAKARADKKAEEPEDAEEPADESDDLPPYEEPEETTADEAVDEIGENDAGAHL